MAAPADAGAAARPSAPSGLAVTALRDGHARLVWGLSRVGDAAAAGYRVYRNGRGYRRVRGRSLRVHIAGTDSYRVAGIDRRGVAGPKSKPVKVLPGHRPPERPGRPRATGVTDSRVRLAWAPAARRSGRLAGYRIFRDGLPVRQVRGRSAVDRDLAPARRYRFKVAAIDRQGYMSAVTAPLSVKTARPAATQGGAHAFLLASTGESFRDLQRHYTQIGTLYPTYFDCRAADGAITGRDDPLVTRWAQLRGILVLPRFNCQREHTLHRILTDTTLRSATLSRLVDLVRGHGYDGINIDFENGMAEDRDALTAFVSDLSGRLHAIGRRVSVEVSAKYQHTTTGRSGLYDYAALGRVADHVFVMNWGWHWATSEPGAPDDMELTRKVADYVATMPNRSRFVLGTHLYGMDWPGGGGPQHAAAALEYADVQALVARLGARPVLDPAADAWVFTYVENGVQHETWYPDATTIARRVQLARNRGLGIGFWRLGREDQRLWDDPLIASGSPWPD
jgi:spore germination protein YaaH